MGYISLRDGEKARLNITKAQEDEISKLYRQVYLDLKKKMDKLSHSGTISESLRKTYLNKMVQELKEAYKSLGVGLEKSIEKGIGDTATAVVQNNADWLKKAGLTIEGAYSYVPKDIVSMLVTGQLYGEGWTLSKAIWGQSQKHAEDINKIVAAGVAANKSAYDIAKDLETYVNPEARKEWDWSKVYPGTSKKVDYNAQRLARTMISHAYQQSLLATTKYNPFVTGYKWRSAHTHRTCELCNSRDGKIFSAEELPLDHPNGLCTFLVELEGSLEDVANRLGDWANGAEDPALDRWYNTLMETQYGGTVSKNSSAGPSVVDGKDISATFSRSQEFQFPIEDAIHQQGFDGLPRVVDKDTFEQAVSDSKFIAQRTFSADTTELLNSYNDMLLKGKWYVDCSTGGSQYGMGMYCASDYTGMLSDGIRKEMEHYIELNKERLGANAKSMVKTFTLDKSSKIVSFEDALDIAAKQFTDRFLDEKTEVKWFSEDFDDYRSIDLTKLDHGKLNSILQLSYKYEKSSSSVSVDELTSISHQIENIVGGDKSLKKFVNNIDEFVDWSTSDVGMEAALKGYDAIKADGHGESGSYTVILNRTKLIVLEDT